MSVLDTDSNEVVTNTINGNLICQATPRQCGSGTQAGYPTLSVATSSGNAPVCDTASQTPSLAPKLTAG